MTLYTEKMKHYSLIVAVLGIASLLIYLLTPLKTISLGFLIGLLFGYVNLWTIYRKTIIVGYAASKNAYRSIFSMILAGLGFVIRVSLALFAVWLSLLYPEAISLISVITGFSLIYFIILIDMISQLIRKR
ncbi:hypothetical protein GN156_06365 [bacterium LRH843]|nr:hypothetical protein [bacterium LRH843]